MVSPRRTEPLYDDVGVTTMNSNRMMEWESHLVTRAQQGERVAFELLMDLHRASLKGQAARMLRNSEDVSDVVQETSIKAFRAIRAFRPGRPVLPWLTRICRNCCVDLLRQRRSGEECIEKFEFALTSDVDIAMDAEAVFESEEVRRSVEKLPRRYREIVLMRHYRDMELSEIAKELDRPEGTIKSWLFRARHLLRKELDPAYVA